MTHFQRSITPYITTLLVIFSFAPVYSASLHVGDGYPYETLIEATTVADPGDSIILHEGIYDGGIFISNLQGTSSAIISIVAATGETVIFDGGTNAWQFTDAAYLLIRDIIFEHQTGNGLNFDDGGTYNTPAHHIVFENCTIRNISASGNNDLLKLSGLDDFQILNCAFLNGAAGGSGIDMVGCHDGLIKNCSFQNLGSNSIQAKGGSSNIRIEANIFNNGGARAVNLGGSTGLQFFRPIDAPYEAEGLKVYSNIFIGSEAAIAFVGCINTEVVNNTIYLPTKWVIRILQETVDPTRFAPCGQNTFRNNIVYLDDRVNVECNIGSDTAPETFTFSNNMWYQSDDPNWGGPDLPVPDENNIVGEDPLFSNAAQLDFSLASQSQAIGAALVVDHPDFDFDGLPFLDPRTIGAFESGELTAYHFQTNQLLAFSVWPNPVIDHYLFIQTSITGQLRYSLLDPVGREFLNGNLISDQAPLSIEFHSIPAGIYFLHLSMKEYRGSRMLLIK